VTAMVAKADAIVTFNITDFTGGRGRRILPSALQS
jgi:hypothetical protein